MAATDPMMQLGIENCGGGADACWVNQGVTKPKHHCFLTYFHHPECHDVSEQNVCHAFPRPQLRQTQFIAEVINCGGKAGRSIDRIYQKEKHAFD